MNCIECGKPLPEDADEKAVRHLECCGPRKNTWRCHICGHNWLPEVMHLSAKYGYFFANCPMCQAKVDEPVQKWYRKFRVNMKFLMWSLLADAVLIDPAMNFAPRWVTILLFVYLLAGILFILKQLLKK